MLPTILPLEFGGTVHLGSIDDPKFVFFTSDKEYDYEIAYDNGEILDWDVEALHD